MRPSFNHFAVNGLFDDPVVYVQFLRQRRAILFDAGDIGSLTAKQINKLTDVFVTHMHIDHFIGFDKIIRILLRRNFPLNVYGPSGITVAVEGKLKGYTWNLVEEYPLKICVTEVDKEFMIISEFSANERFKRKEIKKIKIDSNILVKESSFSVSFVSVEHDIDVIAFSLQEPFHINIDKEKLKSKGLPVGPWLSNLKDFIRKKELYKEIDVDGKRFFVKDLLDIVKITDGQKISYVVDLSPTEKNIKKVIELVKKSHTLYIEAYFLSQDQQRAIQRNHLTAKNAGYIAKEAQVKEVRPLHVSPKYRNCHEKVISELMKAFKGVI